MSAQPFTQLRQGFRARPVWRLCLIGGLVLNLAGVHTAMANDFNLPAIHEDIVSRYAGVQHIDGGHLDALDAADIVLFDVREPEEYAVSHLHDAEPLNPSASKSDFLAAHGDRISGKTVVFYCSVGHRSSAKARELTEALEAQGATAVYNLKGGIFAWHNERRALYRDDERTRDVHPYNRRWGALIDDSAALKYTAE